MIRFSKIFLTFTVTVLVLWLLPWCYNFLFTSSYQTPFTLYSCIIDDFVSLSYDQKTEKLVRIDTHKNTYTQEEADSILPLFYARQLTADERFPDSINGIAVTPREVHMSNFVKRINSADINTPKINLHPLLESMSGRVDLKMSEDVFRITDKGIEFILMENNQLNKEKSDKFTQVLTNKGFKFPAKYIAGDPNTRKDYDEGYLLLDAEGKLFHMKQMRGRPYVRAIEIPEGMDITHLFITEFPNRKTLGFISDAQHKFYVLMAKTYEIIETGVPAYNPNKDELLIIGDMFNWTVSVGTDKEETFYALDANDFSLIQTLAFPVESSNFSIISFTSYKDNYVRPRLF